MSHTTDRFQAQGTSAQTAAIGPQDRSLADTVSKPSAATTTAEKAKETTEELQARLQAEAIRRQRLQASADQIGAAIREAGRGATKAWLSIGQQAHQFVLDYLGGETKVGLRRNLRAAAISALAEAGDASQGEINKAIKAHWLRQIFGEDVESMPWRKVDLLSSLVKRDSKTEEWAATDENSRKTFQQCVNISTDEAAKLLKPDSKPSANVSQEIAANFTGPAKPTEGQTVEASQAADGAILWLSAASNPMLASRLFGQRVEPITLTDALSGLGDAIDSARQDGDHERANNLYIQMQAIGDHLVSLLEMLAPPARLQEAA